MALQNRAPGKLLTHHVGEPMHAAVDEDDDESYKKDKSLQWVIFWLRRVSVPEEPVV